MAVTNITVLIPTQDDTQSIETGTITKTSVTAATDGVVIAGAFSSGTPTKDALANKNNSLQIYIESNTNSSGTAVAKKAYIKAGNKYPNKILGDKEITTAGGGAINVVILEDISRFEQVSSTGVGTIKITFESGFSGTVWAVAKRAGLKPAV